MVQLNTWALGLTVLGNTPRKVIGALLCGSTVLSATNYCPHEVMMTNFSARRLASCGGYIITHCLVLLSTLVDSPQTSRLGPEEPAEPVMSSSSSRVTGLRNLGEVSPGTTAELLANMSNEMRTFMNGIIGMTELTLDTDLTGYQRELLNTVKSLASSFRTVIDDFGDLSKLEARRMFLEEMPYTLRGTVFKGLRTLSGRHNKQKLCLTLTVDSSVPDYVIGDPFRLRQIIMNLVDTVTNLTEHGQVSLIVRESTDVSQVGPGEHALEILVKSSGVGIPENNLGLFFNAPRVDNGLTTCKTGAPGLSIAISKCLANLMGGDISMGNDASKDIYFSFNCKVRPALDGIKTIEKQLRTYYNHQVLLIDNTLPVSGVDIAGMLTQLGLQPIYFNIEDYPASTETESNRVLPKDWSVAVVDSIDTARRFRSRVEFEDLQVVLIGPVVDVSLMTCLELGITSYMTTPCQAIDLGNCIIPALEDIKSSSITKNLRRLEILIAEDNTINQKLAIRILQKHHCIVAVAGNGLEAVEAVKNKRFDMILMDIEMPLMGGLEATAKIREYEQSTSGRKTPIIGMAAHPMIGDRERCMQDQIDEYLSKPLKQNQLLETISRYASTLT